MLRLLFSKTGNAVWISHLDLMRLFQRAFQRAGLPLTHTKGFNPRPSVSIALPMSVGVSSVCELLFFSLDGQEVPCLEIRDRLNGALVSGIRILDVYPDGGKLKNLAWMDCRLRLEYDEGIPENAVSELRTLFSRDSLPVEKKNKNGVSEQDLIPMLRSVEIVPEDAHILVMQARVHCQNPTLNPMQLCAAITRYMPEFTPDFSSCMRMEIYDENGNRFR